MALLKYMPQKFNFDFIGKRMIAFLVTAVIMVGSVAALAVNGLNFGIDFRGGLLLEVRTEGPANLAQMRQSLGGLGLGEVALQGIGTNGDEVMIRVQRQEGGEEAQLAALQQVRQALGDDVQIRRTEVVGPKVGAELVRDGTLAIALSILAIAAYVWFRFEWQFGVGALVATFHDVIATFGFFALTGMEFNLTTVAAILTIAGYSINDTVVSYDRVRENLRKYKSMPLLDLLNLSANETLSRTLLTGVTTLLAVVALFFFGGDVLRGFSAAMIFGVVIGTFSSIYVAMPILVYFNLRHSDSGEGEEEEESEKAKSEERAAG
ncbi:protein translocase subunit SecF [Telmatospirillum sp. J64-1]|uniref:protein translocase subunit SecF n=1 Tax=Telmatospirillum sp. J64-1 TaxID=2502183 RepID=UPI00115DD1CE|nr:protein translocase subunit SecF [Telmatospirillum sp. J64-1]